MALHRSTQDFTNTYTCILRICMSGIMKQSFVITRMTSLLSKCYNSSRVLAFSTIFFHYWRSWACFVHLTHWHTQTSLRRPGSLGPLTLRLLMSYIYVYIYMERLFLMFLDHTQRRSKVGRTPLDE